MIFCLRCHSRESGNPVFKPLHRQTGFPIRACPVLDTGSEHDLSKSIRGLMVKKYLNDRGFRILEALDQVAKQLNSTSARVSLAWLIARPSLTAPIASATNLEQLNDLIEATKLELDQSSIEFLNQASQYTIK